MKELTDKIYQNDLTYCFKNNTARCYTSYKTKRILYLWILKRVKHLILMLLLNLSEKINLKRNDKYVTLSNLSIEKYMKQ